jgi:hypothetical protein
MFSRKIKLVRGPLNKHPRIATAVVRLFAYLVLMNVIPLLAQSKSQAAEEPAGHCSLPGIPSPRVSEVVDSISALPPALGADAMVRVAVKVAPHCAAIAKNLLERAFEQADSVNSDMTFRRAAMSYLTDSRTSYVANGYSLQMDKLSLQSRATMAMASIDPKMAIQFFEGITPPRPAAAGCASPFVPDVSIYYEALEEILGLYGNPKLHDNDRLQRTFVKMLEVVGATTSPVQLMPLASVLEKATLNSQQVSVLLTSLAVAIEEFPVDDRSLSSNGRERVFPGTPADAIAKLVVWSRNHKVSTDALVHAFRDYVDRSVHGAHCADNLPKDAKPFAAICRSWNQSLVELAPGIEMIEVPASDPPIEGGSVEKEYWHSPKAEELLVDAKHLNFDDKWESFTAAQRRTPEWQDRVKLLLDHMIDWRSSDEESPADYFHQRCILMYEILPYLPSGTLSDRITSLWIGTFEDSPLQWDNPEEWYFEVLRFLRFSKTNDKARTPTFALDSLKSSSNNYLHASGLVAEFLQ